MPFITDSKRDIFNLRLRTADHDTNFPFQMVMLGCIDSAKTRISEHTKLNNRHLRA